MRPLRRHRDFLAWLMSVAVSCNIILAMICCAPINLRHSSGGPEGEAIAGVLCTTGGLRPTAPDGKPPSGHQPLHSQCVLCSHGLGGSHVPLLKTADFAPDIIANVLPVFFQFEAALAPSHFAFAEPTSRGPPRA
jgi:Protein of unknown function (DUF2946)